MSKREQHKLLYKFRRISVYIHFFVMMIILFLLLFFSDRMDYSYKHIFGLKNGMLLCIGFLAAVFVTVCFGKWKFFGEIQKKYSERAISVLTKVSFFAQIYFCYNTYFYTGWDVAVINNGAFELALNQPLSDVAYFSRYPNNLLLMHFFSLIKKADMSFGVLDVNEGIMCILCVQCFLSSLTGYLLFKIVRNLIGYSGAWCAWFCYFILAGSSGWLLIPYSDSMGLFIPVTILYLYQQLENGKYVRWKWIAIGMLSCLGYYIKPQLFIVFIAIIIVECVCPKSDPKSDKRNENCYTRGGILYAMAGLLLMTVLCNVFIKDIKEQLDSEKAFGITHYAMMGLNSVNNGGYLTSDVLFSESFSTKSERAAANVEIIGLRLQDMGFSGLKTHLAKKLLTNYGDGTFAWTQEGNFFSYIYEQKNSLFSPLLRNLIYGGGRMNLLNDTIRQGVWLCILAASLGLPGYKKSADNTLLIVSWTIIGLTLFELLFEARARYLYIYVPFYIIAGVLGAAKLTAFFRTGMKRIITTIRKTN